jgi:hypothetical protein
MFEANSQGLEALQPLPVAIPTCSSSPEDVRIGYVLQALATQPASEFYSYLDIYIWDEGTVPITSDRGVRLVIDLVVRRGHKLTYLRRYPSRGVAAARRGILDNIPERYAKVLMIDDDLVVMPGALSVMLSAGHKIDSFGFIQGAKIEIDEQRTYHQDINRLTRVQDNTEIERIYFGDAAFLLLNRAALRHVRWDIVTRFQEEGLPGEDVAMTLMIADHMQCFGVGSATGFHMSLPRPRWRWETSSDALQLELLRNVVSPQTLTLALPHLAGYIDTENAKETTAGRTAIE